MSPKWNDFDAISPTKAELIAHGAIKIAETWRLQGGATITIEDDVEDAMKTDLWFADKSKFTGHPDIESAKRRLAKLGWMLERASGNGFTAITANNPAYGAVRYFEQSSIFQDEMAIVYICKQIAAMLAIAASRAFYENLRDEA